MKKILVLFTCLVVSFVFFSCTSPYDDGVDLSRKIDECNTEYIENQKNAGDEFVNSFEAGHYLSRKQAVSDYVDLCDKVYDEYIIEWNSVKNKIQEKQSEYASSQSNAINFQNGLSSNPNVLSYPLPKPSDNEIEIPSNVKNAILSIIPSKPNVSDIVSNLTGHTLSEGVEDGYYDSSWKWQIKENSVSDFKILSVDENTDTRYTLTATMRLSNDTRAFDANVTIFYKLDGIKDWQIEYVKSNGMHIVRTYRYDDSVKAYCTKGIGISQLCLQNNSEVALEVGGNYYKEYFDWQKFAVVVAPHSTKCIAYSVIDFNIHYVERP